MAGYKMISMVLLVVLVALAGVSPVFAPYLILTPPAACPGERVTFRIPFQDVVGGGISVATVSPLGIDKYVLSSDPLGLITNPLCPDLNTPGECTFVVSESACGHYTVTATLAFDTGLTVSGPFDVPSTCCPAVGGCVQPVNTFALLSPWLAVIGLVGCVGTAVVFAKPCKKPEN